MMLSVNGGAYSPIMTPSRALTAAFALAFALAGLGSAPVAAASPPGAWRNVPVPEPPGSETVVGQIDAVAPGAAWAAGVNYSGWAQIRVLRWDGRRWKRQDPPVNFLPNDIAGSRSGQAWVVGYGAYPDKGNGAHWDGRAWHALDVLGRPKAVSVGLDGSAWALTAVQGDLQDRILRWQNGTWKDQGLRLPEDYRTYTISARSSGDVWIGGTKAGGSNGRPFARHWNGRTWTETPVPDGELPWPSDIQRIVPGPGGTALALRGPSEPAVLRWNRRAWVANTIPLAPPVGLSEGLSLAEDGRGGVWVAGQDHDTPNSTAYYHWDGTKWSVSHGPEQPARTWALDLAHIPGTSRVWTAAGPFIERFDPAR